MGRMRNCFSNSVTKQNCQRGRVIPEAGLAFIMGSLIWCVLMLEGCSQPISSQSTPNEHIGDVVSYVYEPDSQEYLAAPQRFPLDPEMSSVDALTALGSHLSQTYFSGDADSEAAPIRFNVLSVSRFQAAQRTYRVAVVDMIDPELEALQGFFQGSAGGLTTYYLLTATFMQPQQEPPLLDGLVLLYNGEAFPEIDHVNFRGIVTPDSIRAVVTKVLFRHRLEGSAATG